ncbi:unnamed protein product [Schistosoma turkestanicum]|nr:unnamed protein product [Schistosoma turkestanicum]
MNSHGLPPGWSMSYDNTTGFPFFIDHINKLTTWEDPRKSKTQNNRTQNLQSVPSYAASELTKNRQQCQSEGNESESNSSNPEDIKVDIVGTNNNNNNNNNNNTQRKTTQSYYDNINEPIPIKVHCANASNNTTHDDDNDSSYECEQSPLNNASTPQSSDSHKKTSSNAATDKNQSIPVKSIPVKISNDTHNNNNNNNNNDNNNVNNNTNENACQPTVTDPLTLIEQAQRELSEIENEINEFTSSCKNKAYLLLEDKLEKLMLRLDKIDSAGDVSIRNKRREVILAVQNALKNLENKLSTQVEPDDHQYNYQGEHDITLTSNHTK